MLLLGHVGITLGAAVLLSTIMGNQDSPCTQRDEAHRSSSPSDTVQVSGDSQNHIKSWLSGFLAHFKVRPLIIGLLLPDMIDKPTGLYFLRKTFSSGRIFGHTLLFSMLAALTGICSYRRYGTTHILNISFGSITHLILDEMWNVPKTFFWPVRGYRFEKEDTSHWFGRMFRKLRTEPEAYIPELIGATILAVLVWKRL